MSHQPAASGAAASLVDALHSGSMVISVELRPPRAELAQTAGIDAWIDTYHAIRSLTRQQTFVLLTDSAVGTREEDNLRHLVNNLGRDVPRERVVPFLTCKHSLQYCLAYADRAHEHGFPALVVLGGDRKVGPPRCVEHAWMLRQMIRQRQPALALGGWVNPHADATTQVGHLLAEGATAEFYLTQIVSHHHLDRIERFWTEAERRGLRTPGIFGVFYYRSANPDTLRLLQEFMPVPAEELTGEFEAGASAEEVCARTLKALLDRGVRHVYISNLPIGRAQSTLARILDRVGHVAL